MKRSTWIALGGLGAAAWWLSRSMGGGLNAVPSSTGAPYPGAAPGSFDPSTASRQPDYATVIAGWDANLPTSDGWSDDPDAYQRWMYNGNPPDDIVGPDGTLDPAYTWNGYLQQLHIPASRIKLSSLTKGDLDRFSSFIAAAWKSGVAIGAHAQRYEAEFSQIDSQLQDVINGAAIGSKIGEALASAFGYGAAATASDSLFGFGAGAAVDAGAQVQGLNSLQTATGSVGLSADIAVTSPPKNDPAGYPFGQNSVKSSGGRDVMTLPGMFYGRWLAHESTSSVATVTVPARQLITDKQGNSYVQVGYVLPWYSKEMAADRSTPEWVYCCARMLRTADLIQALLYPSAPMSNTSGDLSSFVAGDSDVQVNQLTYAYDSALFGPISGSIFPPLPDDVAKPTPAQLNIIHASTIFTTASTNTLDDGETSDITAANYAASNLASSVATPNTATVVGTTSNLLTPSKAVVGTTPITGATANATPTTSAGAKKSAPTSHLP